MRLRISSAIASEWDTRCISDVIPALEGLDYHGGALEVSPETAAEIAADCAFYIDPKAVDATAGERAAYRALLRQINP
jgi:hypothetical protein